MSLQLLSAQSWGLVVVLALAELTLVVASRGLAKMFCVASLMLNHSIVLNGSRSFSCPCLLSIPACVQANGCSCYNFLVVPVVYCRGFQSRSLSWFFISSSMVLVLVLQKCSCLSPTADDCGNVGICRSRCSDATLCQSVASEARDCGYGY